MAGNGLDETMPVLGEEGRDSFGEGVLLKNCSSLVLPLCNFLVVIRCVGR